MAGPQTRKETRGKKRPASPSLSPPPPAQPSKRQRGKRRASPSPLSPAEAKAMKKLEQKEKAAAAAAAAALLEEEKRATRKRVARLLAQEEAETSQEDADGEDAQSSPRVKQRRKARREVSLSLLDALLGDGDDLEVGEKDTEEGEVDEDADAGEHGHGHDTQDNAQVNAGDANEGAKAPSPAQATVKANDEIIRGPQEDNEKKNDTTSKAVPVSKGKKVKLGTFESPRTNKLAKLGHGLVRQYISLTHGFPMGVQKEEICWKALVLGSKKDSTLSTFLKGMETNTQLKMQLIDYVWGGATQLRGELVAKARLAVPHAYGLPGDLKGEELLLAVRWLVDQGKMLHGGLNIKERTCEGDPWSHLIFPQLIKAQWWGQRGQGTLLGTGSTNPYLNAPIPQLALVATAIECVLSGLSNGTVMDFNDSVFHPRFEFYLEMLKQFNAKCPNYLANVVQKKIQEHTGFQEAKAATFTFDFQALEDKAK